MSLAEDILAPYEQREPHKLTELQEHLTDHERLASVLGHLRRERGQVINAIAYLASILEDLDQDIAMMQSIRADRAKSPGAPLM